jgi:transcriptional regulator with XRE-family HTH domain
MDKEKVNQRIKAFMENRELTLEELAERTNLSAAYLNSILDGTAHPSLGPLIKISRALGVRLGTFLDDQQSEDPLVIRSNEREEEIRVASEKNDTTALKFHSLGRGKTDRHMEPFFIDILPESASEKTLSSHEGEEFIIVASGSIEVIHGKETRILETGDSIYYNSVVPHRVSSAGPEKATIYAVLYFPE